MNGLALGSLLSCIFVLLLLTLLFSGLYYKCKYTPTPPSEEQCTTLYPVTAEKCKTLSPPATSS